MESFYKKNEEYLAILSHEANENKKHEASPLKIEGTLTVEDAFKEQCHNLAKHELEREIINLRAIFSQTFLPKLSSLEFSLVRNVKTLTKLKLG